VDEAISEMGAEGRVAPNAIIDVGIAHEHHGCAAIENEGIRPRTCGIAVSKDGNSRKGERRCAACSGAAAV
jgi:hypothetical protein